MLKGILMVLALTVCYWLVYLAYGKEGMETRKELGLKVTFQTIVIAILAIFYALLVGLWGMEAQHEWYEYACLVGGPVAYILFVIYARDWSKRYTKMLNEEKEQQRLEQYEKQMQQAQREKQEQEQKIEKEERIAVAKTAFSADASFACFLEKAAQCQKYAEMLELWDSLKPAENDLNALIRKDIEAKLTTERMYGANPRGIPKFLETMKEKYGTVELETVPEEEEAPPLPPNERFEVFLERAAQCQKYAEMLELWDSQNWENTAASEAVREEIKGKLSVERMYGANPRGIPNFLEKLKTVYEDAIRNTGKQ